jgi:hypothetical protein
MTYLLVAMALCAQTQVPPAPPPSPPPDTEIYLASLTETGRKLTVGPPSNVSASPGYDNQPSFTPDGQAILFTSVRGGRKADPKNSAASGSDIYRYDIKARRVEQVTDTAESEYSPTVTPDGRHISVIRVEADGTQRLWRFTTTGQSPELVLSEIKPVGYHAWAGEDTLVLFVLGQPATLQVADSRSGKAEVLVRGIGRSIQRMPDGGISFVRRQTTAGAAAGETPVTRLFVERFDPKTRTTSALVAAPEGSTEADLAWTPGGTLLMTHKGQLLGWRRGDAAFQPVADLEAIGLKGVTRMAVSPDGTLIAIVAQKP